MGDSPGKERALELAWHYVEVDRPRQALEALADSADSLLEDVEYWRVRGCALFLANRHEDAAEALQRGLGIAPLDVDLLSMLARCEAELGRLADAEKHVLAALQLSPDEPGLLLMYANLVARAGQFDKSERLIGRAAELAPDHAELAVSRSFLATLRGRDAEAAKHAREHLAERPDDPRALLLTGGTLLDRGQPGPAYERMRRAAHADPTIVNDLRAHFLEARYASHWLMWPLRPILRFGVAATWMVAVGAILGLQALGLRNAAAVFAIAWLVLCVYSWIVPPLLRRAIVGRRR